MWSLSSCFRIGSIAIVSTLVACAPGAVGASGGLVGVALFVGLVALVAPRRTSRLGADTARAGAPIQCDGDETPYCSEHGHVQQHCCPKNAKCNYKDEPFIECGHGLCTPRADIGRCPSPEAWVSDAKSEPDCQKQSGDWELVCAKRVVTGACLPPMPTNYSGPGRNPLYRTCGRGSKLAMLDTDDIKPGDRCSTHVLIEDCYPVEDELGFPPCPGTWEKVCLGGKISERCLPLPVPPSTEWRATRYVACDDGSCAIGASKDACR